MTIQDGAAHYVLQPAHDQLHALMICPMAPPPAIFPCVKKQKKSMSYYVLDNPVQRRTSGTKITRYHFLAGQVSKLLKWLERRRAIAALQELDDWLLDDIGVARNDIPQLVRSSSA
jgi:uncharacterized protein YjiS (DUF1127 family)